ncbi:MAG: hypothetical protein AAB433_21820 [Nitrospirota bacterium]
MTIMGPAKRAESLSLPAEPERENKNRKIVLLGMYDVRTSGEIVCQTRQSKNYEKNGKG